MPKNKNNNKKFNLKKYETDVAGVSLNKLETGLWIIKNKEFFKKIIIILLIAVIGFGWVYSIYNFGEYLLFGMKQDEELLKELVNNSVGGSVFFENRILKSPTILSVGGIGNSSGSDFYALISNSNDKYTGELSYCFVRGAEELYCGEDFILPSDKKYILALNIADIDSSSALRFLIKDISWKRIDSHEIPNWSEYSAKRTNIKISGITVNEDEGEKYLSFSVKNDTPYGFWEVPLKIVIERYNKAIAANSYILSQFLSYEERKIEIKWPSNSDLSGSISIKPDINILDQDIYMPPER